MILSSLFSCKSLDNRLLLNKENFDKDVKPMRVIVNYESLTTCFPFDWAGNKSEYYINNKEHIDKEYFDSIEQYMNVIKNNLTFEAESSDYYLSIILRNANWSLNVGYLAPSMLTLFIFNLFGGPMRSFTYTIELEAAIMNPDGKVIKTYKARGIDTEYSALYYGYNTPDDENTAAIKAFIKACKEIRVQLKKDVIGINKLVK